MTDDVEDAIWRDVLKHASGCWTWTGPKICRVVCILADMTGNPLPIGRKMYRMPHCSLGIQCVNPQHVGTGEDYLWHLRARHSAGDQFTQDDLRFLSRLGVLLGSDPSC